MECFDYTVVIVSAYRCCK